MDLIRRDTDYALRLAAVLACQADNKPMSAKQLSQRAAVPYPITCKLLQKLSAVKIVKSARGAQGGFGLARPASQITFGQVVAAIQGKPMIIRCLMGDFQCPQKGRCPYNPKLAQLQQRVDQFLEQSTLAEFLTAERNENNG